MNIKNMGTGNIVKTVLAVALFIAAIVYLILHWGALWGRVSDHSIAEFDVPHLVPVDPTQPMSQNNPADPKAKGMYIARDFASEQGKLWLYVFPNDPTHHLSAVFQPRLTRGTPPPWIHHVLSFSDPVDRALAFAEQRGFGGLNAWLRSAGATSAQMATVKTAWGVYTDWQVLFSQQQHDGTAAPDELAAMQSALAAFDKTHGDIFKDHARQQAAQQVYAAGMAYVHRINAIRDKHLQKLFDAITATLTDTEKTGLTGAIQKQLKRFGA